MGWPVCNSTLENETIVEADLWDGGITFHSLSLIIGGVFSLLAIIISLFLIMKHATHYSKPDEQRHVIRILFMVPIYSIVAWISILIYKKEVYFSVLGDCYEAFAISAFFALLCHYIAPDLHSQKDYFRGIKPKEWVMPINWMQKCCGGKHGCWRTPRSGLTWFNIIWTGVFQYCLLRVLMTIVAVITEHFNVYCEESDNPAFAHIWVTAVECVAVSIAMYCLIQFYIQVKDDIAQYRPFLKILAIKLVIFLSFWQSILITFLYSGGVMKATKKIAAQDWKVTLPNLLICVEMAFFAILHLWAFPWRPYELGRAGTSEVTDFYGNGKETYQGGRFGAKAFVDCLNPLDLFKAIARGFRWLFVGRKRRTLDPSYHITPEAIGLDQAEQAEGGTTAYQGAGSTMMTGGRQDHIGTPPDEEGAVLLSHAQPAGMAAHDGDIWLAPSPYEEDNAGRYYGHGHRQSGTPMLEPEPASHTPRPYSPYDDLNNPYLAPDLASEAPTPHPYHQETGVFPHPQETGVYQHNQQAGYPHSLQEQVPIPMPETYQPPPLYDDDHHARRQ